MHGRIRERTLAAAARRREKDRRAAPERVAIGTPAVGIFWLTNLIEGTPLRQGLLRAALSVRVHCPVCGAENLRARCRHDASFVSDVAALEVTSMATSLLHAGR